MSDEPPDGFDGTNAEKLGRAAQLLEEFLVLTAHRWDEAKEAGPEISELVRLHHETLGMLIRCIEAELLLLDVTGDLVRMVEGGSED